MDTVWIIGIVAVAVLLATCWASIFKKAGYSPWYGLVMVIPMLNLASFLWLAFAKWPIYRRRCSSCGAKVDETAKFCKECGSQLSETKQPAAEVSGHS